MSRQTAKSKNSANGPSLSLREKLCYGLGDVSHGLAVSSVTVSFLYYLTEVAGMEIFLAGVAVTIGRLWDAVTDPIMGWITDHTKSRWGKRLPYLLFGAIPYALSYCALWMIPEFESYRATFIWVTLSFVLFNTCLTVVFVPYTSLTAAITNDYNERTSLTGFRMVCSQIAFLVGAWLPTFIQERIAGWSAANPWHAEIFGSWAGTPRESFFIVAVLFAMLQIISIWITFFGIKERPTAAPKTPNSVTSSPLTYASSIVEELFCNRPFLIAVLILLLSNSAGAVAAANLRYYLKYALELDNYSNILGLLFISAILSVPIWVMLAKQYGKAETYRVAMIGYIFVFCLVPLLNPENNYWIIYLSIAIGVFYAAALTLPWAMIPDVVEYDQLKTGQRREGLFYGGTTFCYKLATGIAFLMSTVVLNFAGYSAGQEQTATAINSIKFLVGPAPALILAAAVLLAFRYPLTADKHKLILAELATRS